MPEMDGIRLAKEIRKLQQAGHLNQEVLLFLVTGDTQIKGDIQKEYQLGENKKCYLFDNILYKPFSNNALRLVLERYQLTPASIFEERAEWRLLLTNIFTLNN